MQILHILLLVLIAGCSSVTANIAGPDRPRLHPGFLWGSPGLGRLADLAQEALPGKVILGGHSMGSRQAVTDAVRYRGQVDVLILLDPVGEPVIPANVLHVLLIYGRSSDVRPLSPATKVTYVWIEQSSLWNATLGHWLLPTHPEAVAAVQNLKPKPSLPRLLRPALFDEEPAACRCCLRPTPEKEQLPSYLKAAVSALTSPTANRPTGTP